MWSHAGKTRRGALQDLPDAKSQKMHKKSKIITTTTTITHLLCCLPTNLQTFFSTSDSQIESVVLVVVLLLVCCVLWWNSILTRHSLFSPSADLIILGCKVPVSEVPSSYYCWLLFACAASACAACFSFPDPFPFHAFVHEFTIIVGVVRISPPVRMRELVGKQ